MDALALVLSDSPIIRWLQVAIIFLVLFDVYLVFFVMRDVLLRTESFAIQVMSVLLAGVLPVIGFLAYLLLRPSRTLKEREMEELLHQLLEQKKEGRKHAKPTFTQEEVSDED